MDATSSARYLEAMRSILLLVACCLLGAAEPPPAAAGVAVGPNPSAVAFFEEKIRPQLIQHCHECHAGGKRYGGLKVDSLAALLAGGHDEGPAVIPGDIVHSSLLRSIRWEGDSDLNMPPKRKLPAAVIADFEHWVAIGAPWPDGAAPVVAAETLAPRPPLIGRIHPIVIHLPIVCLLIAVLTEALGLLRGAVWRPATALLLITGTAGAILAVITGLNLEGAQDPDILERHELLAWLTLAGALIASGLLLTMRWVAMPRWPLLAVLAITALLAGATGHLGGQMSWGRDWLPF